MNYLGLDWGKSKIGIALGSDDAKVASPILTLSYKKILEVTDKLKELIEQEEIQVVVIGQPISLAGESNLAEEFNDFVKKIKELNVQVVMEDERLSTKYAQVLMQQYKGNKKVQDDEIAAAAILQTYFDRL